MRTGKMAKICFLLLLAAAGMLSVGCLMTNWLTTKTPVFDKELTSKIGATVFFGYGIAVKKINGVDVKEKWYGKTASSLEKVQVVLPAGKVDIMVDLRVAKGTVNFPTWYDIKDMKLSLDLEAGKKYSVVLVWVKTSGFGGWASGYYSLGLYDTLTGGTTTYKENDKNRIALYPLE